VSPEERAIELYETYLGRTINVYCISYNYRNGKYQRVSKGVSLNPGLLCRVVNTPEDRVLARASGRIESEWNLRSLTNRESLRGASEYFVTAFCVTDLETIPGYGWDQVDDWFGGRSLRGNHGAR
jgi:hypothetical protein